MVTVMDDYSRFILTHRLQRDMTSDSFIEVVQEDLRLRSHYNIDLVQAVIVPVVYDIKSQLLEHQIHLKDEAGGPMILSPEGLYGGGKAPQFVQSGFNRHPPPLYPPSLNPPRPRVAPLQPWDSLPAGFNKATFDGLQVVQCPGGERRPSVRSNEHRGRIPLLRPLANHRPVRMSL